MSNITGRDPYLKPWNKNLSTKIYGLSSDFWTTLSKWNDGGQKL